MIKRDEGVNESWRGERDGKRQGLEVIAWLEPQTGSEQKQKQEIKLC